MVFGFFHPKVVMQYSTLAVAKRRSAPTFIIFSKHFTRPNTFHFYFVARSSQTPLHCGQQTQDELFRELDKTLYCV